MNTRFDVAIIGAGIIGLATGMRLLEEFPGLRAAIFEKENMIAAHQTGHNSGVIHSGLYYRPGSFKARLCTSGRDELIGFCRDHNVKHEICGKVVIATRDEQLPALAELFRKGSENGVAGLQMLSPAEVKEFEPYAECILGMRVPGTGIVDFRQVAKAYAEVYGKKGGELLLGARVKKVKDLDSKIQRIETNRGEISKPGPHKLRRALFRSYRPVLRHASPLPDRSFPGRIPPDKTEARISCQKSHLSGP